MKVYFVYITTANHDDASLIGRALVEENLAACANIIEPMTSIYRWEGRIQQDQETVLIAKTTEKKIDELTKRVKQIHSYDCPCISAIPVEAGNADYLNWIAETTR
ncbi:MAG: divalent-cation tolerance protein CutA [Balneolales bacterium]